MSNLDLNKAQDFQRLTLQNAGGVLQTIAELGRDPAKWDLLEGSYNGVLFHVFQSKSPYNAALSQIQDIGGRRKVKYKFPYKDGQTTDDLGRKPETFDLDVLIHGNSYMTGFTSLLLELDKPTPGNLVHPIRGTIKVVPEDHQITHIHEKRKAVQLRLTFAEHNFTIGDIRQFKDTSVKGALARALDAFQTIDNAITNIIGVALFARSLKNQIQQGLTDYKNEFGQSLSDINNAFNQGSSVDIPTLLPVNQGGIVGNTFQTVASPSDKFQNLPITTQQQSVAIAASKIVKNVVSQQELLESILQLIETGANGAGSLEFYQDIVNLKETAILMQDALEKGIASSNASIVAYVTPRDMTIREVAFANGLSVDRVDDIDVLNPQLGSVNFIAKSTTVQVPIS